MGDADIQSGFANRWLYVPGHGKPRRPSPPELDERRAAALYAELADTIRQYERANAFGWQETAVLRLHPEAVERWDEWYVADGRRDTAHADEDTMRSRLAVQIRKVALIYAASEGADDIRLPHLEAAIAFVEWVWVQTREQMRLWGVGVESQIERRIEDLLTAQGAMKRRDLQMRCRNRKWSSRDFANVFKAMVENGTVVVDQFGVAGMATDG